MLRLTYLPANEAWTFTFGDTLLAMHGESMFHSDVSAAIHAAARRGLDVRSDFSVVAARFGVGDVVHGEPTTRTRDLFAWKGVVTDVATDPSDDAVTYTIRRDDGSILTVEAGTVEWALTRPETAVPFPRRARR